MPLRPLTFAHLAGAWLVCALALVPSALAQTPADAPTVSHVRVRATPPGAPVTAIYLQMTAGPKGADRLTAIKVDPSVAGLVEIHDMIEEGGMMKMRRTEGVDVKPDVVAELKPGGKHGMLMNLKRTLAIGDTIKVVLVFEKAGEVTVDAKVEQIGPGGSSATAPATTHKGH